MSMYFTASLLHAGNGFMVSSLATPPYNSHLEDSSGTTLSWTVSTLANFCPGQFQIFGVEVVCGIIVADEDFLGGKSLGWECPQEKLSMGSPREVFQV